MKTRREFLQASVRIGTAVTVSESSGILGRRAHAQSSANVTRVGFLAAGIASDSGAPSMFLKGAPGDLAIGVPSKCELVANLQTARAIGVTFPDSILTEATRLVR